MMFTKCYYKNEKKNTDNNIDTQKLTHYMNLISTLRTLLRITWKK